MKLRVDTSPTVNSYLRFNVSGVSGSATSVTLKIFATSALSAGFEVHALADDTWVESTITSANAPVPGALLATSGAAVANSYVTVTLPPSAVSGNGDVNFVLVGRSTTALAMASRETATPPQLVVTSGGGGGDVTPPSVPTGVNGTPVGSTEIDLSWTASTDNVGGSGVAGYNVYRGGSKVNSSLVTTTNYRRYRAVAVDAVQLHGHGRRQPDQRVGAVVAAQAGDDRIGRWWWRWDVQPDCRFLRRASVPSTNFGSNVKLRVDTSPIVNSYLRFDVSGLTGTVTAVTLKIYATSGLVGWVRGACARRRHVGRVDDHVRKRSRARCAPGDVRCCGRQQLRHGHAAGQCGDRQRPRELRPGWAAARRHLRSRAANRGTRRSS